MVFTNPITTTHVNKTANQPLMSSMVARGYRNIDVANPRGGYREPSTPILDHRDGHYIKPNRVALKYPDFKKNVDLDVHVKVSNFVVKANAKTFEEYIINVFNYMLRDVALN
jgi:hypothetical protein